MVHQPSRWPPLMQRLKIRGYLEIRPVLNELKMLLEKLFGQMEAMIRIQSRYMKRKQL